MKKQIKLSGLRAIIREQIEGIMLNGGSDGRLNQIMSEALDVEPKFDFKITRSSKLSRRYNNRVVHDSISKLTFKHYYMDENDEESEFILTLEKNIEFDEDPDGASGSNNVTLEIESEDWYGTYYVSNVGLYKYGEKKDITNLLSDDVVKKLKDKIKKLEELTDEEYTEIYFLDDY